jgi:hypothetical protein
MTAMNANETTDTESTATPTPTPAQTRRTFLQHLALGSLTASATVATAALAAAAPAEAADKRKNPRWIKVFRLRSRKTVACHACQVHHRYMMFLTKKVAKRHRAHPGCDCPIEAQWIQRRTYRRLFKSIESQESGFVDLRKV